MSDEVFRLIYRSRDLLPDTSRRQDLGALFTQARANNKARDITGALLVVDDWFVQVLEGDEAAVRSLYEEIRDDPRHTGVTVVDEGRVSQRVFGRWSMARASDNVDEPDANLIARTDGIVAASGHGDETPQQAALLREMRAAAAAAGSVG